MRRSPLSRSSAVIIAFLTVALVSSGLVWYHLARDTDAPFRWRLDPSIAEGLGEFPPAPEGERPLAAVADASGRISRFVATEVLVVPNAPDELARFLELSGGRVAGNDAVPIPPLELKRALDPSDAAPKTFVVHVDPSGFPLGSLRRDGHVLGLRGQSRLSSDLGARLVALATRAQAMGINASPNFVAEPNGTMLFSTKESWAPAFGSDDALSFLPFQSTGSKSSVAQAWQFVAAHGFARRPKVAIIGGGFWLTTTGTPVGDGSPAWDLPPKPAQYDFQGDDFVADGDNPVSCTLGACPWHGNDVASVATGIIDNRTGAAGTGGQVADPMLFKFDGSDGQLKRAVRTARVWGADIVSLTLAGKCNDWCRFYRGFNGYANPFYEAEDAGVAVVASAGNANDDTIVENYWPCQLGPVICVGALDVGTNTKIIYSNYGGLEIWAPTNIPVMPNGDSAGAVTVLGGTSASAPFIAGVLAMMKAMDPTLTPSQMNVILQKTAWKDSPDPKVGDYVNAYQAVSEAAGHRIPPDVREPNDSPSTSTALAPGTTSGLSIHHASDKDHFRFTVDDYSALDLAFNYVSGLGSVTYTLLKESTGGGSATGVSKAMLTNKRTYHADLVPPGTYRLVVESSTPNLYDLTLRVKAVGLSPDRFEPNNTLATAAPVEFGSYPATHHTTDDQDYYAFDVTGSAVTLFSFHVEESDWPVTVRLVDPAGTVVTVDSTLVTLPAGTTGTYRVEVERSRRGRYVFEGYHAVDPALLGIYYADRVPVRKITPGDPPYSSVILDKEKYFVFEAGRATGTAVLAGAGLHLSVLTADGTLAGDGHEARVQGQVPGEELALQDLVPGALYVLRVALSDRPDGQPSGADRPLGSISPFAVTIRH